MSDDLAISAVLLHSARGHLGGEIHSCLGIDLHLASGAPCDELLRIDLRTDDPDAPTFEVLHASVSLLAPLVVSGGENISIFHDLEASRVSLTRVPRDAGDLYLHCPVSCLRMAHGSMEVAAESFPGAGGAA